MLEKTPKYPRLIVSGARHNQLKAEAKRQKVTLTAHVEKLLSAGDKKKPAKS